MRLLNTTFLHLQDFFGSNVPPYVILSHTWEKEEVLFEDFQTGKAKNKKGFKKLEGCCKKAAEDGFEWVWIDTCCINKGSSSELSEAINSMYQCRIHPDKIENDTYKKLLSESVVHQRVDPAIVEFYTAEWCELGTKSSMQHQISDTTKVPTRVLRGEPPSTCSVAERMSWASARRTTREEDMAYCLLGLFGVNMPMLYGEGQKSFVRLQEEIMKQEEDYSIFAWSHQFDCSSILTGILGSSPADFSKSVPPELQMPEYQSRRGRDKILADSEFQFLFQKDYEGIHATDPRKYETDENIKKKQEGRIAYHDPPQLTSRGLRLSLPFRKSETGMSAVWIYCTLNDQLLCILVEKLGSSPYLFARSRASWLVTVPLDLLGEFETKTIYLLGNGLVETSSLSSLRPKNQWGRIKITFPSDLSRYTVLVLSAHPTHNWSIDELFYRDQPPVMGVLLLECNYDEKTTYFIVVMGQCRGAPWCEVLSASKSERSDLEAVFRQSSELGTYALKSDRSILVTDLMFSAAIRKCPSPDGNVSAYSLRISVNTVGAREAWMDMYVSERQSILPGSTI